MLESNGIQSTYQDRQQEIIISIALEAQRRPLLESGLWFHDDVRNNFYYASYLFAAAMQMILCRCLLTGKKRNRRHRMYY